MHPSTCAWTRRASVLRHSSSPTYSELELRRIFYEYGDEKLAPRYASRIVQRREERADRDIR